MSFLEKWKASLDSLEEKSLLSYLIVVVGAVFLVLFLLALYYFYVRNGLYDELDEINNIRSSKVRLILTKAAQLQQQEKEVNEILSKERDFKIGGYAKNCLAELNLLDKLSGMNVLPTIDKAANYNESSVEINLNGIDMKQLVDLMQKFEENKRVYLKKLDITRSKVMANKLEVTMTLATLLLK